MSIKFTKLSTILAIATLSSLFAIEAKAETKPLDEAFKDAYYTKGKNAFEQSSIVGQINTILGFTGFPEQHISADGQAVDKLYQEGLKRQAESGEPLVTRDLENPYDTSIRENPTYSGM